MFLFFRIFLWGAVYIMLALRLGWDVVLLVECQTEKSGATLTRL